MSNVEQTGFLPSPFMALSNTQVGVLNRHGIPGERDHLCAMSDVEVMESRALERIDSRY